MNVEEFNQIVEELSESLDYSFDYDYLSDEVFIEDYEHPLEF